MPLGNKSRTNKRSSPTSYASTITMVVFVGLCFIGVWMLTSDSGIPVVIPQTSSHNSDDPQTSTAKPDQTAAATTTTTPFEDNPGDLPDEAIKSDNRAGDSAEQKQPENAGEGTEPKQPESGGDATEPKLPENASDGTETKQPEADGDGTETKQPENGGDQALVSDRGGEEEDRERNQEQKKEDEVTTGEESSSASPKEENGSETRVSDHTDVQEDTPKEENDSGSDPERKGDEKRERKKDLSLTEEKSSGGKEEEGNKVIPTGPSAESYSGIPKESKESKQTWSTQAAQSENEKERRKDESDGQEGLYGYTWHLCNVTAGADYIPCLDNEKAIKKLRSTRHFEHRERHCPENAPTCLVPLPEGYQPSIQWPASRDKIWYHNVPHTLLVEVKGHQNWVKVTGEFLTFPGGGTQFIHGALHYIDFLQQSVPGIAWGKQTRVILDVGCGVASFGGYIFERDVLTMSFAPKDEHEAQVQFALERGIPAISAVMGSQRLPFPARVFDLIHCARCRVPWHAEGGLLLLELNRVLRPGGYFVWSATPVYQKLEEDVEIWNAMSVLTASMCWELVTIQKDKLNSIGAAIYRKPTTNECYDQRKKKQPPMCKGNDDANAAWYVPLQTCMHRAPVEAAERGTQWPDSWPRRVQTPPYWLNDSQMGIYGKPAKQDFAADYEHWKRVVNTSYMNRLGIGWDNVRNVMDMRAVYGGFAAAMKDLKIWVMNVVNVDSPDTLPIIYERGLFGIYHDWCESFSTYPRTYDVLHADHLFSKLQKRCKLAPVLAEVDRIVRPGGKLIVRDESRAIGEVENLLKSLHWEVRLTFSKNQEGILSAQKGEWRPKVVLESY